MVVGVHSREQILPFLLTGVPNMKNLDLSIDPTVKLRTIVGAL